MAKVNGTDSAGKKRQTALAFYAGAIRPHKGKLVLAMALGAIAGAVSGFGVPYFIKEVFAKFFEAGSERLSLTEQLLIASALPAIFVVRGVAAFLNQYLLHGIGQDFTRRVRCRVFGHLQALPMPFFERRASGDLLAGLVADTQQIQATLNVVAKELFLQPFVVLAGLSYLVFLSWREEDVAFLLMLLVVLPFMLWPLRYVARHLRHRSTQLADGFRQITERITENLRGVAEIRAFNRQDEERRQFEERNEGYVRTSMKVMKYYLLPQPAMEVMGVVVVSLGFLYAYREDLGLGTFISLASALYFTLDGIKRIARLFNEVQRTEGSYARLQAILDEPVAPEGRDLPSRTVTEGRITAAGLQFRYPQGQTAALLGLDFDLAPGTVCAVVGPSGAGKSTLVKLLLRFHDPCGGELRIDGVDARQWKPTDLRDGIALVPQAPVLFDASVADNLRWGRADADDAAVEAAAQAALAHDFICALPEGYNTRLGENGVRLSGGQRQRIALARAFLRDAPILLLDEATSALDSESEALIQLALERLVRGRTVVIIAHRLSSIRLAQRVLVLENGRLTADGSPEAVRSSNSFFASLCASQGGL